MITLQTINKKAMMRKIIVAAALAAQVCLVQAQEAAPKKAETKLYNTTLKKPSLKAYDKFLSKYPASVYAAEIQALKDSTIDAGAELVIAPVTDGKSEYTTKVFRLSNNNVPSAFVVDMDAAGGDIRFYGFAMDSKGVWSQTFDITASKYILDAAMDKSFFVQKPELVTVGDVQMVGFSYLNVCSADPKPVEFVEALVSLDGENFTNTIFYGNSHTGKVLAEGDAFSIEGRSPDAMAQGGLSREQMYLMGRMNDNPSLVEISEADALTDDSLEWWFEKNPGAQTTAKSLKFGVLPEESSLVAGYKKAAKESSGNYSAAKFDIRGYTVIVAYSKSSKEYYIVWAEPVCKNRNTDQYLNSIYFTNNSSNLNLFYYKGKKTFKYYINLANKTIQR